MEQDELLTFLEGAQALRVAPPETTLFSTGSRGHWENPTSDLLRFFMSPDGAHHLGSLFLTAFLECMGETLAGSKLSMDGVQVFRECPTKAGRLDLLVLGTDWVLAIENKIRAPLQNDLEDYANHARSQEKSRTLLAVLSPNFIPLPQGWRHVAYQDYLGKIAQGMEQSSTPLGMKSKWHLFAHEFILHLRNEVYPSETTMDPLQFQFVETHLLKIEEIRKLASAYTASLRERLEQTLNNATADHTWKVWDDGWCLKGRCDEIKCEIMFQSPAQPEGNPRRRFRVGAWLSEVEPVAGEELRRQYSGEVTGGAAVEWDCSDLADSTQALDKLSGFARAVKALSRPA